MQYKDYNGHWILLKDNNVKPSSDETKVASEFAQCAQTIILIHLTQTAIAQ